MATSIITEQDKLRTAGDLYISFNYDGSKAFDDISAASIDNIRAYLLERSFVSVGSIKQFNVAHEITDEREVVSDNCGQGTVFKTGVFQYTANWTWLDVDNMPVLAEMLGLDTYSQTDAPVVGHSQVVTSGDWAYATVIALANQNGDESLITVTSVTGSVDGALVAGTDYTVTQDALGRTVVTPIAGGALTITEQDLTIVYDYTPYARTTLAYKSQANDIPFVTLMFVSCEQQGNTDANTGLRTYTRRVEMLSKMSLTGTLQKDYVNLAEDDFAGSATSFVSNLGGVYFEDKITSER